MFCGHVNLGTAVTMFLWDAERGTAAVLVAFVACMIPYAAVEWSDHRKRGAEDSTRKNRAGATHCHCPTTLC